MVSGGIRYLPQTPDRRPDFSGDVAVATVASHLLSTVWAHPLLIPCKRRPVSGFRWPRFRAELHRRHPWKLYFDYEMYLESRGAPIIGEKLKSIQGLYSKSGMLWGCCPGCTCSVSYPPASFIPKAPGMTRTTWYHLPTSYVSCWCIKSTQRLNTLCSSISFLLATKLYKLDRQLLEGQAM